jgi:uncharacterized membrane protein YgcG
MNKKFIIIVTSIAVLFIIAMVFLKFKNKASAGNNKETVVELSCPDGYTMTAKYYAPDKNGILSKLSLTVIKDNKKDLYEMNTAMSASGAKFETSGGSGGSGGSNGEYFLWEHQGDFMFGQGYKTIVTCRASS